MSWLSNGRLIHTEDYGVGLYNEIAKVYKELFRKRFGKKWTPLREGLWLSSWESDRLLSEAGKIVNRRRSERDSRDLG